jgi:hypothetical protein
MIAIQVNTGDDLNQNWINVDENDMLVFSNGYLNINSGLNGVQRIVAEFNDVNTPYAKFCHLIDSSGNITQINYGGDNLYNATNLFLANPDQSNQMNRFSFRVSFIDYYIDWIKIPQIYTLVPSFFYSNSNIDTLITPFFYTDQSGLAPGDLLEIDGTEFIASNVQQLADYFKIWVSPYDSTERATISKNKYLVRDYNLPATDSTLAGMPKILFHDDFISLQDIPQVLSTSDITDESLRTFRTTYE